MIQQFAETLKMHHLAGAQEFYHLIHIRIVRKAQDIIIRCARLLFSRQILGEICYGISFRLNVCCSKGNSGSICGIHGVSVIYIVVGVAVFVEASRALAVGKLSYD